MHKMPMDSLKLDLISWISGLENEDMLRRLNDLKSAEGDWWDELPSKVQELILESRAQHEAGQSIAHEEQVEYIKKYL